MKTKGKAWQLVLTVLLIAAFVYTAFFGVAVKYGDVTTTYIKGAKDIRFGVDIKGGVNVTFVPSDGYDATDDQLEAAQLVIENRLVALNVTDYELYVDNNSDSLILEFPWQSGETEFDPEAAIEEIGTTAYLTFREGSSADGELVLDGSMVESAAAQYGPVNGSSSEYYVALKFTDEGAKAFGDATTRLYQTGGTISIWLDDENVSTASVNAAITDGSAIITGVLLAFNLPSNLPIWIIILGALFAIGVGKMSFGGLGCNPFNPALAGRVFLLLSFPVQMTSWLPPHEIAVNIPGFIDAIQVIFSGHTASGGDMNTLRLGIDGISQATPLDTFKTSVRAGHSVEQIMQYPIYSGILAGAGAERPHRGLFGGWHQRHPCPV